ncbi:calcium-binding protein [Roseateles cellulosilyticus]|uniref:Haemolysin-type calcium binding-related domain-containing protein n=1 Tax=Pelomonas cellulosilytica TaxID=2906762 RepID=A0ABS8Y0J4_9BURK|nr:calcium-binding protein [Pelomonas sp. P8]MCE4556546.1 hypothetical protein [Pelomonas sp. P8]
MPKPLTLDQINDLKQLVQQGDVNTVIEVYRGLQELGYAYAGWAKGVAAADSVTGVSAMDYLAKSAFLGVSGEGGTVLTQTQIDRIRMDMSRAYLDQLAKIATDNNGLVNRDVNFAETRAFHEKVFVDNGLGIQNWTLDAPMELIRRTEGEAAVEVLWQKIRETEGTGIDAIYRSTMLAETVHSLRDHPDPAVREIANNWLNMNPGLHDLRQLEDAVLAFLRGASPVDSKPDFGHDKLNDSFGVPLDARSLEAYRQRRLARDAVLETLRKEIGANWRRRMDPLILDLDGDGVETVSLGAGVAFDHAGDGARERTGWVGADDGLLALDLNGDGRVNSGRELFGNYTWLDAQGSLASDGFQALARYDENGDGKVDMQDAIFGRLLLWQDKNLDGLSSADELSTLAERGVKSIHTAYETSNKVDGNDNERRQIGLYETTDGRLLQVHDVWFQRDVTETVSELPASALTAVDWLPNLAGMGNVVALHEVMVKDATLLSLVETYLAVTDVQQRRTLTLEIVLRWTGAHLKVDDVDTALDDRKLYALGELLGRNWTEGFFVGLSAAQVDTTFGKFADWVGQELDRHVTLRGGADVRLDTVVTATGLTVQLVGYEALRATDPRAALLQLVNAIRYRPEALSLGWDGISLLKQELARYGNDPAIIDYLAAIGVRTGALPISGGDGRQSIVLGTDGADVILNSTGLDLVVGGKGDDTITVGQGDRVFFGAGDGHDIVQLAGEGAIEIILRGGIKPEMVAASESPNGTNDLLLTLVSGDMLTIKDWFNGTAVRLGVVRFSDGTAWYGEEIFDRLHQPTGGNDTVRGSRRDEVLRGEAGNDVLLGAGGYDVLFGGAGQDTLYAGTGVNLLDGGEGNDVLLPDRGSRNVHIGGRGNDSMDTNDSADVYYFNRGDGQDTISDFDRVGSTVSDELIFGPGIAPEDLLVRRVNFDMVIRINGGDDMLTLRNWYSQPDYQIERIVFDSGVIWRPEHVESRRTFGSEGNDVEVGTAASDCIDTGAGNDDVMGWGGNDTIIGGLGDDRLSGDAGSDRFVFAGNFGSDVINDGVYRYGAVNSAGDVETIILDRGSQGVTLRQGGYGNLSLMILMNDSSDRIEVSGFLDQDRHDSIRIEFADGVVWAGDQILQRLQGTVDGSSAPIIGTSGADVLLGDAADNLLRGGQGNDRLDGGAGIDSLNGGSGNDTYLFGFGSGRDTIRETDEGVDDLGVDTIIFGPGVRPQDILRRDTAQGIEFVFANGVDQLNVDQTVLNGRIERAVFEDGTVWNLVANPAGARTGTAASDAMWGSFYDDLFNGGDGNDTLDGGIGNDVLSGGGGADVLHAGGGRDVLDGGVGDDSLFGTDGTTFVFDLDYGFDQIFSAKSGNVRFGAGIRSEDLSFSMADGGCLLIGIPGTRDALKVYGWLDVNSGATSINRFEFADGTLWGVQDIWDRMPTQGRQGMPVLYARPGGGTLSGWEGADDLRGSTAADHLLGGDGWDQLFGGDGDDTLEGGGGYDTLDGGAGDDTYVFNDRNFGRDTITSGLRDLRNERNRIVFGPGIRPAEVSVIGDNPFLPTSMTRNLYLAVIGTSSSIKISDWFDPERCPVQSVEFADGTVWSREDMLERYYSLERGGRMGGTDRNDHLVGDGSDDEIDGGVGNDTLKGMWGDDRLYGDEGDDVLDGGRGQDLLSGGLGDDTYVFERGYGVDTIMDVDRANGSHDRILLGEGILPDLLRVTRDDAYLVLTVPDSGDQLRILWYPQAGFRIEELRFFDGTVWAADELEARALAYIRLTGTLGADSMSGSAHGELLFGLDGNDVIFGLGGEDTLDGGAGNDTLDGGSGADRLIGGDGDDVYRVDDAGDVVVEAAGGGRDRVESTQSVTLFDHVEEVQLLGLADSYAIGNAENNLLRGNAGNNVLSGGLGADVYSFGRGWGNDRIDELGYGFGLGPEDDGEIDEIRFDGDISPDDLDIMFDRATGGLAIGLRGSTDWLSVSGFIEGVGTVERIRFADDTVLDREALMQKIRTRIGTDTDEVFYSPYFGGILDGRGGNDQLYGDVGNDQLFGGDGFDQLYGGEGDDLLDGGADGDLMMGGWGDDVYIVDHVDDAVVEYQNGGADTVRSSVSWALSNDVEHLQLTGTAAIDGTGNGLANTLIGNAATNILNGGTGNDTLDGGGGADTMIGGAGDDTFIVDDAGDVVTEVANGGTDLVKSPLSWTLGANVENLTLTGSAAINGAGNTLANKLTGNAANNVLDGGAGSDTLLGGLGDDIYIIDSTSDVVTENAGEGTDTIQTAITLSSLAANVENLTLTGTGSVNATGNTLNNVLAGNSGANRLNGGAGADTMIGGAGNDTYVVDNAGDVITEVAGGGTDAVEASISYTLAAEVENLTLTGTTAINGTGNALANSLTGNSADNRLDGGAGADTMTGGAGNDTYVIDNVGDSVVEAASAGTDTVEASITYTLGTNVENLTLTGTAAINGTGNSVANKLIGNSGDNVLNGGAGNDTMLGGAGNDTYVVDVATDVVTENANEGTDTVQSGVTWTLGANLENLTLTGTTAINGTGNTLDNVLTGNSAANNLNGGAGNDTLDGGAGTDTLVGGAGNDTYFVDVATDVITENANEGIDTVKSAVTWTLSTNLENLTLTGTTAINGTGNASDNVLIGNSANNTLTGGAGNDTLDGGAGTDSLIGGTGNDSYYVDASTDVVTENANEGTDTVYAGVTWTLGNNLENLTLTGTAALNGTGNALDNLLTGNAGNNTLTGGAGNDTLDGGAGNDTLNGGLGADTYLFGLRYGSDLIIDSDSTANVKDVVKFGAGIAQSDIRFTQSGNSLVATIKSTSESLTIQDWYLSANNRIEEFRFNDGTVLTSVQAQALVGAMAAFNPSGAAVAMVREPMGQGVDRIMASAIA